MQTLHLYISKELLKVTSLALVAFTLVMTIFAIIEPLRKWGLASDQVAALFGYTLPVMLSLTLPVAALFAATIVYGRFSQDNELLACRASGIATFSLLKPAMVLGAVVTVVSLTLSNFVSPQMVAAGAKAVEANVRGILYRQIRTQNYVRMENLVLHADQVDPDHNILYGVVAAYTKKPDNIKLLVANSAYLEFGAQDNETWMTALLVNPAGAETAAHNLIQEVSQPIQPFQLPNPAKEQPSWYTWGRLIRAMNHPEASRAIREDLSRIRRRICYDMTGRRAAQAINAGKEFELDDPDRNEVYRVKAAAAELDESKEGTVFLSADGARRVQVMILRGGKVQQTILGDKGTIEADRTAVSKASLVAMGDLAATSYASIELKGNVTVQEGAQAPAQGRRLASWAGPQLVIPKDILDRAAAIKLEDLFNPPADFTARAGITKMINDVTGHGIQKNNAVIKSEMHGRAAYGMSCFLLVSMGAALGLIFRGGQLINAFAISVVPASVVIIMMIMGRQVAETTEIPTVYGLSIIWSGVAAMVVAVTLVYLYLARK